MNTFKYDYLRFTCGIKEDLIDLTQHGGPLTVQCDVEEQQSLHVER